MRRISYATTVGKLELLSIYIQIQKNRFVNNNIHTCSALTPMQSERAATSGETALSDT